jgi:hypothetical protein
MRREFSTKTKALPSRRANGRCEKCGFGLTPGKYHMIMEFLMALLVLTILQTVAVLCTGCHEIKDKR